MGSMRAPGLYPGIPEAEYHADDALSQSGAKLILKAPAHYRWAMDHPPKTTATFNLGHAVHSLVLGSGRPVTMVQSDDYKTKAAREERDHALTMGAIPLTRTEHAQVAAMAEAVLNHPLAAALFTDGQPGEVNQ